MFKVNYSIIDDSITKEELTEFLKNNNIYLDIIDNSSEWAAFAQYYGRNHGLDDVASASFSYMVSHFMTGMGLSAQTDAFFKEESLEYDLLEELNSIKSKEGMSEVEQAQEMFHKIFEYYYTRISDYEYKTEKLGFRLGISTYMKFMKVEGENKTEKLQTLLENYFK